MSGVVPGFTLWIVEMATVLVKEQLLLVRPVQLLVVIKDPIITFRQQRQLNHSGYTRMTFFLELMVML